MCSHKRSVRVPEFILSDSGVLQEFSTGKMAKKRTEGHIRTLLGTRLYIPRNSNGFSGESFARECPFRGVFHVPPPHGQGNTDGSLCGLDNHALPPNLDISRKPCYSKCQKTVPDIKDRKPCSALRERCGWLWDRFAYLAPYLLPGYGAFCVLPGGTGS